MKGFLELCVLVKFLKESIGIISALQRHFNFRYFYFIFSKFLFSDQFRIKLNPFYQTFIVRLDYFCSFFDFFSETLGILLFFHRSMGKYHAHRSISSCFKGVYIHLIIRFQPFQIKGWLRSDCGFLPLVLFRWRPSMIAHSFQNIRYLLELVLRILFLLDGFLDAGLASIRCVVDEYADGSTRPLRNIGLLNFLQQAHLDIQGADFRFLVVGVYVEFCNNALSHRSWCGRGQSLLAKIEAVRGAFRFRTMAIFLFVFAESVIYFVYVADFIQIGQYHLFGVLLTINAQIARLYGHHHGIYLILVQHYVAFFEVLIILYSFILTEGLPSQRTLSMLILHNSQLFITNFQSM